MTEFDLRRKLEEKFLTLNDVSGIKYLTDSNVNYNRNSAFVIPSNRRWFSLNFIADEPDDIGIGNNEQERITGIFQIDICVPIDKGEDEAEAKFKWIKRIFPKGSEIDEITVNKVYRATSETEENYYKVVVRVEWTADITRD